MRNKMCSKLCVCVCKLWKAFIVLVIVLHCDEFLLPTIIICEHSEHEITLFRQNAVFILQPACRAVPLTDHETNANKIYTDKCIYSTFAILNGRFWFARHMQMHEH